MKNIIDETMSPLVKLAFDTRILRVVSTLMDFQDMISRPETVSLEHAQEDVNNLNRQLSRAYTIRDFALIIKPVIRSMNQVLNEIEESENYE